MSSAGDARQRTDDTFLRNGNDLTLIFQSSDGSEKKRAGWGSAIRATENARVFAHGKDRSQGWSRARTRWASSLLYLLPLLPSLPPPCLRLNAERWKLSEERRTRRLFIFKGQQLWPTITATSLLPLTWRFCANFVATWWQRDTRTARRNRKCFLNEPDSSSLPLPPRYWIIYLVG